MRASSGAALIRESAVQDALLVEIRAPGEVGRQPMVQGPEPNVVEGGGARSQRLAIAPRLPRKTCDGRTQLGAGPLTLPEKPHLLSRAVRKTAAQIVLEVFDAGRRLRALVRH